jgi:cellulose synthase (UDP-forming)
MKTYQKYLLIIPVLTFGLFVFVVENSIEDTMLRWFSLGIFVVLGLFNLLSMVLLLAYKEQTEIEQGRVSKKTNIDVFLPICGEDISILQKTWSNVQAMKRHSSRNNMNINVFVLDDTATTVNQYKVTAQKFGFNYIRRPDVGVMKKAGNLKYGFGRTIGKYIVIFDADFAPEVNFLDYTIPIIDNDSTIGIIQTPQKFNLSGVNSWEYGASVYQDFFYDVVQKAWEAFDGAICVGSNAVYRRSALNKIGGTFQIDHSEDIWTGYLLKSIGYKTTYLNKALAFGQSPDDFRSYFKQQMRWCQGSLSLMTSLLFWLAPVKFTTKLCYISGFLFYLTCPLYLIMSLMSLVTVNDSTNVELNGVLLLLTITSFWIYCKLIMPRSRFITFVISLSNQIIYSFAILTYFLNIKSTWIPSGTEQKKSLDYTLFQLVFGVYFAAYLGVVLIRFFDNNLNAVGVFWIIFQVSLLTTLGTNIFRFSVPKKISHRFGLSLKLARKYMFF